MPARRRGSSPPNLEIPQSPEFEMGGGGSRHVSDYLFFFRFARMILSGGALDGARVLAEPTVALMSGNAWVIYVASR